MELASQLVERNAQARYSTDGSGIADALARRAACFFPTRVVGDCFTP